MILVGANLLLYAYNARAEQHAGSRKWLAGTGQAVGPLMTDAALAAIEVEHGAILHTTDRDFARFPGLKWVNPLAPA